MLLRIASFACLGGFLYGYDLGLISGALGSIKDELHSSEVAIETMVGAAKFGAIFGTFLGGSLMLHYGRRLTIGLDSLFFVLGPIIMAFSAGIIGLTTGRFLVGLGIGVSAVVVPAYLGEVAPARVRGRIVEMYEVMLCLGMLSAMVVDASLQDVRWNWRWMVGAPVVPALFLALALVVLPESPRWLVVNARLDEALAVIHRVYTDSTLPLGAQQSTAEVEQELMELWSSVEKDKAAARDRAMQARQSKVQGAWRHLRYRRGKWHPLEVPADGPDDKGHEPSPAHPERREERGVELSESLASPDSDAGQHEVVQTLLPLRHWRSSEEKPEGEGPGDRGESAAPEGGEGRSAVVSGTQADDSAAAAGEPDEDVGERQASHSLASTSAALQMERAGSKHLRVAVVPVTHAGSESSDSEDQAVQEALKDPTSPLYRSLSSIPVGLAPVRTASGLEDSLDPTPYTSQLAPRKGGLSQRRSFGAQLADAPKSSVVHTSFWRVFWDMMLDIRAVAVGPEAQAFQIALCLAFFNQATASSAIINYAPQLLEEAGVTSHTASTLLTLAVTGAKIMGVLLGVTFIDTLGRRPLLIWGSAGCAASLFLLFGGVYMHSVPFEIIAMCVFMLAFNSSYAGVFWVLLSEIFSMSTKSPAASAATAMLFIAGFLADSLFLTLLSWFGAYSFVLFGSIATIGGAYSFLRVPETKGKTLAEVQALLQGGKPLGSQAEVAAPILPVQQTGADVQSSPSQSGPLLASRGDVRLGSEQELAGGSRIIEIPSPHHR